MINLLSASVSPEKLLNVFTRHGPLSAVPAMDSPVWALKFSSPFARPIIEEISRRAREETEHALPELTDALYRDYANTGVRLHFEGPYFERRRQLGRAAIALLQNGAADDPALVASFLTKLEDVFSESSWSLPAHVKDPSGRDPLMLDLLACDIANQMSELLFVFAAIIPPPLAQRIRERLRHDVFENYRDNEFWWQQVTHNWNAVCHQGILGAALAVETDAELLAAIFSKASRLLPAFISGFGDDGACSEGPSYWNYGFGAFAELNEQIEIRTRGEVSLFFNDPKIEAIAGFGPAMSLTKGRLINFSDCLSKGTLRASTLGYLGDALNRPDCSSQAIENYARFASTEINYNGERADFFYWSRFFLRAPHATSYQTAPKPDVYIPSLGIWSVRRLDSHGHVWEVAAKGGNNGEHHNHNDVGSFLLNVDGIPLITEIGMPEYNAAYFSDRRYEQLAARTRGHSLPLINGHEQATGVEFSGTVLRSDGSGFKVDATSAYPEEAACRSFIRTIDSSSSNGGIQWNDTILLDQPGIVEGAFTTDAAMVRLLSAKVARLEKDGVALELHCEGDQSWDRIEDHPYRARDGSAAICRRIVLKPVEDTPAEAFSVTITARLASY